MKVKLLIIAAIFCTAAVYVQKKVATPQLEGRTLVFADEFDYRGLPNPKYWGYEVGFVRNKEAQYYTSGNRENAVVKDGCLEISGIYDPSKANPYTSASVITLGKVEFLYGRIEVRAKIPTGVGSWPAIWMLGTNRTEVKWPHCGEIDIMENVGYAPLRLHGTLHSTGSVAGQTDKIKTGGWVDLENAHTDFHVFAIEWTEDKIDFFVDGEQYFSYAKNAEFPDYWRFDKPMYLLLNLAIGGDGTWGGAKGIDNAIFPLKYYIDYVRYYK